MSIADNLQLVRQRMDEAARAAGRDPGQVRLVAVSKLHPAGDVAQGLAAGQVLFGESYVQEAQAKIAAVGSSVAQWHFIGHLQSNKARMAAEIFHMVETVHSLKLAQALARHWQELGRRLKVLVQVNLGGEAQKSGCLSHEAPGLAQAVAGLPGLELKGLMTIPPFFDDPEQSRPIFAELYRLSQNLAPNLPSGSMDELSMGMSGDFEAAIAEGSTLVRVGTAIFSNRG
ncbi:Pyridoxal phosphate homeostasis protein [Desulfarculales bacterium]